jgi:hypothetical protein
VPEPITRRLYFKSYLAAIRNSLGSNLFRNFYVHNDLKGDFDATSDGQNSCAFFVSGLLVMFGQLEDLHGTVDGTIQDLVHSGWKEVSNAKAGDIVVWEGLKYDDGVHKHIGFSLGNGRAVSMSWTEKCPNEHDEYFNQADRKIDHIFRTTHWDN